MKKLISIERDVQHGQSCGCWLAIHFRYTIIYFRGWWKHWQGIRLEINAPQRSQDRAQHGEFGRYKISF